MTTSATTPDLLLGAFSEADSDKEKIQALIFAAQLMNADECSSHAKLMLLKSIGSDFLERMLFGKLRIASDGCPKEITTSTALTIISCCTDSTTVKRKELRELIPAIVQTFSEFENSPRIVSECLQFIKFVIHDESNRKIFFQSRGYETLVDHYIENESDDSLALLTILIQSSRKNADESMSRQTNKLINHLAREFERNRSAKKFKLCSALRTILCARRIDISQTMEQSWPKLVRKGLRDILTSRIDERMRDPALELASVMLNYFGVNWLDGDILFQKILGRLASIEIQMQLEDRSIDQIFKTADLVASCMNIIEITDVAGGNEAYSAAFAAVLSVLKDLSSSDWNPEMTDFIHATIRFFFFGLIHNILTPIDDTGELLPFVIDIVKRSFYAYKKWSEENGDESSADEIEEPVDLMILMLPLIKEPFIIVEPCALFESYDKLFIDCLEFRWNVLKNESSADSISLGAVSNLLELFIAVILSPKFVPDDTSISNELFKRIITEDCEQSDVHVLISVLGLVLLNHRQIEFKIEDPLVVKIINNACNVLVEHNDSNNIDNDGKILILKTELKNLAGEYSELENFIKRTPKFVNLDFRNSVSYG